MVASWAFLGFDDEESVSVLLLFVSGRAALSSMLASNLCSGDRNRAEMLTTTLHNTSKDRRTTQMRKRAYTVVVFQDRTLEDEEAGFPATEIFATLRQIPFLMSDLHDRLFSLPHDVGSKERDHFIVVLDRELYERLQVGLQYGLY